MRVIVTTIATATIEERWWVEMTPEQLKAVQEEPYAFLDLLATDDIGVIWITDKTIGDEADREVTDVEEAPDDAG
jgi:hypothetical protein